MNRLPELLQAERDTYKSLGVPLWLTHEFLLRDGGEFTDQRLRNATGNDRPPMLSQRMAACTRIQFTATAKARASAVTSRFLSLTPGRNGRLRQLLRQGAAFKEIAD